MWGGDPIDERPDRHGHDGDPADQQSGRPGPLDELVAQAGEHLDELVQVRARGQLCPPLPVRAAGLSCGHGCRAREHIPSAQHRNQAVDQTGEHPLPSAAGPLFMRAASKLARAGDLRIPGARH